MILPQHACWSAIPLVHTECVLPIRVYFLMQSESKVAEDPCQDACNIAEGVEFEFQFKVQILNSRLIFDLWQPRDTHPNSNESGTN